MKRHIQYQAEARMISIRNEGQLMEKIYYNGDIITMKSETDNPECVVTQNDTIIHKVQYSH